MFPVYSPSGAKKTFILFADVNKIAIFGSQKYVLWKEILQEYVKLQVFRIY